jgi:CheY-like chemotaxis protein
VHGDRGPGVKFGRANPATRDTPTIVLSSKEGPAVEARAFALGANDYLVTLPDRLELVARARCYRRAYLNRPERDEAHRQVAKEVAQAARYVRSLLPERLKGGVSVSWRFVPSTRLGGDLFGHRRLGSDYLAVYLPGVSGHGAGPSLLAVSAANLLSAGSLPVNDFRGPGAVVARPNDVFRTGRQSGKYFTTFYGAYDRPALAGLPQRRPPDLAGAGRERLGSMERTMQQLVESTDSIFSKLAATREKADTITQVVTTSITQHHPERRPRASAVRRPG